MLQYSAVDARLLELLRKLLYIPELKDTRLVGGTALALQLGHRKSIDLDFFGHIESFEDIPGALHHFDNLQLVKQGKSILIFLLDGIKLDIVNYPYPWLRDPVSENGLRLAHLEDIAAMKLGAVTGRGTKKDFYDLYLLLEHYSLKHMLDLYLAKYKEGNEILVLKSLAYFADAEKDVDPDVLGKQITWESVKSRITGSLKEYNSNA